jgi:hypothetical protein
VACDSLVVELSTAKAVGTGSVLLPSGAASSPDTVDILGFGSFGVAEGAPVGWVAVNVGSGVTSVTLSEGSATDSMTPQSGVAVLALPGDASLTGATVVGDDQSGAPVTTVPVTEGAVTTEPAVCGVLPVTSPPTSLPDSIPSPPAGVSTPAKVPTTSTAP